MTAIPTVRAAWAGCLVLAIGIAPVARAAGRVDAALAAPPAEKIPADRLKPAVEQAVASGAAALMARILADGNEFGLAVPPRVVRKRIGTKKIPARKEMVTEDVYENEYAEVDQLVPELSAGAPTGRFVKGKVKVVTKSRKVGTRQVERLIADPEGSYTKEVPEYGPGGPDVYELNLPGFNGMALWILVNAGQREHAATTRLAGGISELVATCGISDHTFDVAWLAAGLVALGPDSDHARLAKELVGKLVDGQVREKGEARGLWGPVCINYGYFSRLFDMQQQLRHEVEVRLPQALAALPPQQQGALVKQGQEMKQLLTDVGRSLRSVSSLGTRLIDVTEPHRPVETIVMPGLPTYIYNRVVVDVESTAAATFALAEARRAGMLPPETPRVTIRGKKAHPGEKTEPALKLAAERLAAAIRPDGGCTSLVRQGVTTGFDKSSLKLAGVPFTGAHPALFEIETAATDVSGQAALEFLAAAAPDAVKACAAQRERAGERAAAIARRWYTASAAGYSAKAWPNVYQSLKVSQADLTKSAALPQPPLEALPVDELPWGRTAAFYEVVPQFSGLFAADRGAALFDSDLFRLIAYRLVSLQGDDGQWKGPRANPLSSGFDALAMETIAARWHRTLANGKQLKVGDPVTFQTMLRPLCAPDYDVMPDAALYATLTSLAFLVRAIEQPVSVAGVQLLPEQAGGEPLSAERAAALGKRPNAARAALFDAVLGIQKVSADDVPVAAPASASSGQDSADQPADEPAEDLGAVEDLLAPQP